MACLPKEKKTAGVTGNVDKAIFAFKQFLRESNSELRMFSVSRSS